MGRKKDQVIQAADGQTIIIREKGGRGCFKNLLILFVLLVVVVIGLFALLNPSTETAEQSAARNAGRGTLDTPIPVNEWMQFKDGQVRATKIIRPANTRVKQMNMFNDDAPAGADYVLVWFEVKCEKDHCRGNIDLDLWLIDDAEKQWGEPTFITLEDNLDSAEALRGSMMAGWQVFEYPTGKEIEAIRIRWSGETLHTEAPKA